MTFDHQAYQRFIASKGVSAKRSGFAPEALPVRLFTHQRKAAEFSCEKGKSALFLDTGLGKSGVEAVFADECRRKTNRPSLILTPLAVAWQMKHECEAFGVEAKVIREDDEVSSGVNIANYERLPKLRADRFGAVVLDESSILKNFTGQTKRRLVAAFAETPYRLAATATPAPNDHTELGQHSEFLDAMPPAEMLSRWFITDQTKMGAYRLKGHAERSFWRWVSSWARAASMPSDLGGDDQGFILPSLSYRTHVVDTDLTIDTDGALFRLADNSATSIHKEKALTLKERVGRAASIANGTDERCVVWCERDDESAALAAAIPDAVEVKGSLKLEEKEKALEAFLHGYRRVMVTKPKIAGFGLNLQFCHRTISASITHSYEQFYQLIRRFWRFGQMEEVIADVILAETELPIWANVRRKADDHERMKRAMSATMREAQNEQRGRRSYDRPPEVTLPAFLARSHAA